ncbi:MAG: hypothetical protein FJX77_14470 [Armatimonadetes bacterium]|nr:hypothetical protein [Armatimonadota bacterium]
MSILRATGPVTPDRDQWLNRLEQNAEAQNLMLDWFNRGGLAALGGGAGAAQVRRFGSGAEMLSFLRENTLPEAHVLPLGTTQWTVAPRDRRSARPRWLGSKLGYRTAAYCLTNGIPLVNVRCSNPVSPILESVSRSVTPGAAGPEAQELPAPAPEAVALPQYTASNPTWTWPQISLMSAVLGSADGPAFPICAPAVTLVATAAMPPQIPMPAGIAELPHCSPSRITIGRISTLGADAFAIREEEGTAESRRR